MKIRTDFVTNSSSASFIIRLYIETENKTYQIAYGEMQYYEDIGLEGTILDSKDGYNQIIKESPFMVKPNKDEMTMLFGEKDLKDVLNELYSLGVEIPFVTLGGGGAALFDGKEYYRFTVPRLEVKNTVGSGDSTIGGIATGLCRGMTVCDAVRLGMAAGMANTQFEESGRVSRDLVERFYGEIKISQSI